MGANLTALLRRPAILWSALATALIAAVVAVFLAP